MTDSSDFAERFTISRYSRCRVVSPHRSSCHAGARRSSASGSWSYLARNSWRDSRSGRRLRSVRSAIGSLASLDANADRVSNGREGVSDCRRQRLPSEEGDHDADKLVANDQWMPRERDTRPSRAAHSLSLTRGS